MQIHIISSIPPILRGIKLESLDESSLQSKVLHSWKRLTNCIYSVHTTEELKLHPNHELALRSWGCSMLEVNRAMPANHSLLPSISDLLHAVSEARLKGLIIVTNSDIIFNDVERIRKFLASIKASEAAYARRININSLDEIHHGLPDNAGFDFFAFHSDSISSFISLCPKVLSFGVPWWDLYLPLVFMASGLALVRPANERHFLHINHEDRWNRDSWFQIGTQVYDQFMTLLNAHHKSDLIAIINNLQKASIISTFSSPRLMYRYLRFQLQQVKGRKRIAPMHLFSYAERINQMLEEHSIVH